MFFQMIPADQPQHHQNSVRYFVTEYHFTFVMIQSLRVLKFYKRKRYLNADSREFYYLCPRRLQ